MSDAYRRLREFNEDISGTALVDTADTEVIQVVAKPLETIYIQRVIADVTEPGPTGTDWQLTDDSGTAIMSPIFVDGTGQVGDNPQHQRRDFGATGRPLMEGGALVLLTDPGASGLVTWEGYRKLTNTGV